MDTLSYKEAKDNAGFINKEIINKINEDESGYTKMLYDIPLNASASKKWHDILGIDFNEFDEDKELGLNQKGKFEIINNKSDDYHDDGEEEDNGWRWRNKKNKSESELSEKRKKIAK